MLMDGGGSNSSRHYIFKQDLQVLADEIGVNIRVAHYPPYTSKWNPVEHKAFPHITRAMQGVVLTSHHMCCFNACNRCLSGVKRFKSHHWFRTVHEIT
jgi:hypothetical protein